MHRPAQADAPSALPSAPKGTHAQRTSGGSGRASSAARRASAALYVAHSASASAQAASVSSHTRAAHSTHSGWSTCPVNRVWIRVYGKAGSPGLLDTRAAHCMHIGWSACPVVTLALGCRQAHLPGDQGAVALLCLSLRHAVCSQGSWQGVQQVCFSMPD